MSLDDCLSLQLSFCLDPSKAHMNTKAPTTVLPEKMRPSTSNHTFLNLQHEHIQQKHQIKQLHKQNSLLLHNEFVLPTSLRTIRRESM